MERERIGFKCPNEECHFFVTRRKLGEILTDPTHAAVRFASTHEREIIDRAIAELGVIPSEFWRAPATKS